MTLNISLFTELGKIAATIFVHIITHADAEGNIADTEKTAILTAVKTLLDDPKQPLNTPAILKPVEDWFLSILLNLLLTYISKSNFLAHGSNSATS